MALPAPITTLDGARTFDGAIITFDGAREALDSAVRSMQWPSPALTDIHDRAAKSRKDVQNGDHGRATEATTAVVFR